MKYAQTLFILMFFLFLPVSSAAVPRDITAQWQYPEIDNISGFHLYQEGNLICSTDDPQATSLECSIDTPDGESWFTLTAAFNDGTESAHSEPLAFIFSSGLKAQFILNPNLGETPLPVSFDAAASIGTILSYEWMFGDGEAALGSTVSHTYVTAGNYTVTLKVTDDTGSFDQEMQSVSVTEPVVDNTPPTAVLSSSTTAGRAPLAVQFDGSGSTDSDGTIFSYAWDLGDGGTDNTPLVNYTYNNGGTFYSSLTVTDNGGLSDSVSTPVVVQPSLNNNVPPIAAISASTKNNKLPTVIQFNGSKSHDSDGKITAYSWDFADGTVGSGKTIQHTFMTAGKYKVSLKVTDDQGAVSQPAYYTITTNNTNQAVNSADEEALQATQIIINFLLLKPAEPEGQEKQQ